MPWKPQSAFGLVSCLLMHLLLAVVVNGADVPVVGQDAATVTKASCTLVIQGHSAGDVQPLHSFIELDKLNSTEVSLKCTPPDAVSVMVPINSWLAPYTKNMSGVKLVEPEACAFQASLSSAGEVSGNRSGTQYCAMSVCGGNTSHLQVVFDDSVIELNLFDHDFLASHPYLLCLQGLAHVTFSSAMVSGNQYFAGVFGNDLSLPSIIAVDRDAVFNCNNCSFVQNYGARPLAVWGNASLSQTNISNNIGALVGGYTDTGAVLVEQGANLHANGCVFSQNVGARNGSALYARGTARVDNCTFDRNEARFSGGAIRAGGAPMHIRNSTFDGNEAEVGGAVAFIVEGFGMDLRIESCSFSGNAAYTRGGGIGVQYDMVQGPSDENVGHFLRIVDATMHNNSAVEQGSCVSISVASDKYKYLSSTQELDLTLNYVIENSSMKSSITVAPVYGSKPGAAIYLSVQVFSRTLQTLQLDNVTVDGNLGSGIQADLAESVTLLVKESQILGNRWVRVPLSTLICKQQMNNCLALCLIGTTRSFVGS